MSSMTDTTLQINLSPGDLRYAEMTVPALVAAHPEAAERLAVVDCCRPQRTKIVNPDSRFPEPEFSKKVERIIAMTENFQEKGIFDRIEFLHPDTPVR